MGKQGGVCGAVGERAWKQGAPALLVAALGAVLAGCGDGGSGHVPTATVSEGDAAFADVLRQKLLDARPGDVIEVPAGRYSFDRSLSLRVDNVTLRGAGQDKSVLSFKGQKAGAEGLLVNADHFTIENLAIEDAKGDGLKINEAEFVTIRGVRVEWTGGPKTANGGYGLYPVRTRNVLIEDSIAIGASDAGIYVGQSQDVIVRNNRAEYNVAGIEIENTINADVYGNVATNNTGGILVFNMPALKQPGGNIRVFKNQVFANNTGNFGAKGTPVASVPAGSGVVINSNDDVTSCRSIACSTTSRPTTTRTTTARRSGWIPPRRSPGMSWTPPTSKPGAWTSTRSGRPPLRWRWTSTPPTSIPPTRTT